MNYPYGEHVLFTDNHPILSLTLKSISKLFPFITDYSIGILNFILLCSILITSITLFKVFEKLNIQRSLSVLAAISITILAPQIFRLTGHYSLSYSFCIPLTILLILHFFERDKKWRTLIGLMLNGTFWLLIHPYLGLMSLLLPAMSIGAWVITNSMNRKFNTHKIVRSAFGIILLILPVFALKLYVQATDNHIGRTKDPYGYFEFYADFDTILLPHHGPLKRWIDSILPSFTQSWEGWAYIGIIGNLFLFLLVLSLFHKKLRLFFKNTLPRKNMHFILLASVFLLLFAFGFPFRFGLENYLSHFGSLKQFRAIGRFAWPFYFTLSISGIICLEKFTDLISKTKVVNYVLFAIVPLIISVEGISYHLDISKNIQDLENPFSKQSALIEFINNEIDVLNYQAILPLPYYHYGSENIELKPKPIIEKFSMILSYHAELPLMSNSLGRTSIPETKNLIQLMAGNSYPKDLPSDLINQLPILIIQSNEVLNKQEKDILAKAQFIGNTDGISFYSIEPSKLLSHSAITIPDSLQVYTEIGFKCINIEDSAYTHFKDYESEKSQIALLGNGSKTLKKCSSNEIHRCQTSRLKELDYKISLWILNDGENFGQDLLNNLNFKIIGLNDKKPKTIQLMKPMQSPVLYDSWTRCELTISNEDYQNFEAIVIELNGLGDCEELINIDNFLMTPTSADCIAGGLSGFYNNHPILGLE
jgi:hypothetical protein